MPAVLLSCTASASQPELMWLCDREVKNLPRGNNAACHQKLLPPPIDEIRTLSGEVRLANRPSMLTSQARPHVVKIESTSSIEGTDARQEWRCRSGHCSGAEVVRIFSNGSVHICSVTCVPQIDGIFVFENVSSCLRRTISWRPIGDPLRSDKFGRCTRRATRIARSQCHSWA